MRERRKVWKSKRPVAVTIVAWMIVLLFLVRLYQVYLPLMRADLLEDGIQGPFVQGMRLTPTGQALLVSASYLAQVLVGIVVLIGFLRLRRWAWVVLMAWTGISLAITLINYFYSHPNYIVMASNVIIAFALSQSDVQRIFKVRVSPDEPAR